MMTQIMKNPPALSAEQIAKLTLDNPFWQYSLELWKNKALQCVLIDRQDELGLRINLVLFAMWMGRENRDTTKQLASIESQTRSWHEQVVSPLRQIRKSLPKHAFKSDIQQSELKAEQVEQALLFDLSKDTPKSAEKETIDTLIANLLASRLPKSDLSLCIHACLPDYSEADILAHIDGLKDL